MPISTSQVQLKNNSEYISLAEGADYSGYSQDYLRFRIRQGKLMAKKFARNWVTTKEWLDIYLRKVEDYKNKARAGKVGGDDTARVKKKLPVTSSAVVLSEENEDADGGKEKEMVVKLDVRVDRKADTFSRPTSKKAAQPNRLKLLGLFCGLAVLAVVIGFLFGFNYPSIEPFLTSAKQAIENTIEKISDILFNASAKTSLFLGDLNNKIFLGRVLNSFGGLGGADIMEKSNKNSSPNWFEGEIFRLYISTMNRGVEWLKTENEKYMKEVLP